MKISHQLNFHGAGYKPSPLGGKVFSKYFPWLDIGVIMFSNLYLEDKPWERNDIETVHTQ